MMKKQIFNILILAGVLVLPSCKKDIAKVPFSVITDDVAYSTAERCLLVLHGVYDAAQNGNYLGTAFRGYPFGAAHVAQGEARGEDVINIQAFYQITYQATYNPSTANNNGMGETLYAVINKANIAIAGFQGAAGNGVLTAAVANQYEAEARFLRALSHHELLIHFCRPYLDGGGNKPGVPYRDFPINSSSAVDLIKTIPRGTVAETYSKILADLDYAETNLATTLNPPTIRATKAAAIALKMRIKMHMGDWPGVIAEGNKLVPGGAGPYTSPIGGWNLTSSPDGPFLNNSSSESIFSIRNDALDNPQVNGALARMFGPANLGARGLVSISPIIYNNSAWLCDDKRRSLLTVSGTNANAGANGFSIFTKKYTRYTNMDDFAPHIRYAEVLLTLAEAEARQAAGVSQRAVDLMNAVRNRSLADPGTQAYTLASFANKTALIGAILMERRIEFLAEGKRWADIHRLAMDPDFSTGGIPAKYQNGSQTLAIYGCGNAINPTQAAIPYSDYRFIWPIPSTEVIQNPIIEQNPGY